MILSPAVILSPAARGKQSSGVGITAIPEGLSASHTHTEVGCSAGCCDTACRNPQTRSTASLSDGGSAEGSGWESGSVEWHGVGGKPETRCNSGRKALLALLWREGMAKLRVRSKPIRRSKRSASMTAAHPGFSHAPSRPLTLNLSSQGVCSSWIISRGAPSSSTAVTPAPGSPPLSRQ